MSIRRAISIKGGSAKRNAVTSRLCLGRLALIVKCHRSTRFPEGGTRYINGLADSLLYFFLIIILQGIEISTNFTRYYGSSIVRCRRRQGLARGPDRPDRKPGQNRVAQARRSRDDRFVGAGEGAGQLRLRLCCSTTSTAPARGADGGRVVHLTAPRFAGEMWELVDGSSRAGAKLLFETHDLFV